MNNAEVAARDIPDRDREFVTLSERVAGAISRARKAGADSVEATASLQAGLNVTVRMGEVETIEHHRDRGISVTVNIGRSKGQASSADLRKTSLHQCVERAMDIARFTQEDRCNGLADPQRLASEFPDFDLWHPRPLDAARAIERAQVCEAAGRADDRVMNSEGASVSGSYGMSVYGNSNGFMGQSSGTRFGQSCILIAGQGESMQRDYWYDSRRDFGDLEEPADTGRIAAERTVRRLGAEKIPTCEAPVMFTPEVAKGLIGHFLGAVSGGSLYRNASFLKDTLGEELFPAWLDLVEMPHLPKAPGSAAFDAEGVATRERKIVERGVLTGYVLSSYSARRLGMETTGNAGGMHNLVVKGKEQSFESILKDVGTGLLVTEVMGQGVSLLTGDYSRGASGFWIENGEISHPVEEVTIAGTLRNMFKGITAVGIDLDHRGNIQSGSILVDRMTIAGS